MIQSLQDSGQVQVSFFLGVLRRCGRVACTAVLAQAALEKRKTEKIVAGGNTGKQGNRNEEDCQGTSKNPGGTRTPMTELK